MATIDNWKVGTWSERDHDTRWKAPNLTCLVCLLILLKGIGISTSLLSELELSYPLVIISMAYCTFHISHLSMIFPANDFSPWRLAFLGVPSHAFWNTTGWSPGAKKTHRFWPSRMLYSAFGRSMPMTRGCLDCLDERLFELWWVVFGMFLGLNQQKWPYKPRHGDIMRIQLWGHNDHVFVIGIIIEYHQQFEVWGCPKRVIYYPYMTVLMRKSDNPSNKRPTHC